MSQAKRQQVINNLESAIDDIEAAADNIEEGNAIGVEVSEEAALNKIRGALAKMELLKRQRTPKPPLRKGLPRRMRQR